jgi:hypothetical protein
VATQLPVAWRVATARDHESSYALPLLDATLARGFSPETCVMDLGYDTGAIHDGCEQRGVRPIVPLKKTPAVKCGEHRPPECEHGTWAFAWASARSACAGSRRSRFTPTSASSRGSQARSPEREPSHSRRRPPAL